LAFVVWPSRVITLNVDDLSPMPGGRAHTLSHIFGVAGPERQCSAPDCGRRPFGLELSLLRAMGHFRSSEPARARRLL